MRIALIVLGVFAVLVTVYAVSVTWTPSMRSAPETSSPAMSVAGELVSLYAGSVV